MDKNTVFNSKKYIVLLIIICLIFFILVMRAFEYLPQTDKDAISSRENLERINTPGNGDEVVVSEEDVSITPEKKKEELNIVLNTDDVDSDFEVIDAPPGTNVEIKKENISVSENDKKKTELTEEETALRILISADRLKNQKEYSKALEEYQKVIDMTISSEITASGYEGIAKIYAINKRYGTALSMAIKSFNLSPSSEREFLLAKLYYKTGDTYKASQRVNNILKRDFSDDN